MIVYKIFINIRNGKQKEKKGQRNNEKKAKEKAFIGVDKGLPVTQKLSQKEGLFFIAIRQFRM